MLTKWHCLHSPVAAAAVDLHLLNTGPTAANLQHWHVAAEWYRETEMRRPTVA